ncbi:MAG: IclR family transcriptional regulator C-terminal domain-containing protein [Victivallaceae bacterium]
MSKVPALQRGLEIIQSAAGGNRTVTELESELGIPKASFGRLLRCLTENGFVKIDRDTRKITLGEDIIFKVMKAHESSAVYIETRNMLRRMAAQWLLTFVVHECVQPFTVYWRAKEVPLNGINTPATGHVMTALNICAQGQLFLSQQPDSVIRDFFASGLIRKASEYTLTEADRLMERFSTIRSLGYAYQEKENNSLMKQLAVPLRLRGSSGNYCLTCYMPLDFSEVNALRDSMLFEAGRLTGVE